MRILLTGGTGFIGQALVAALGARGDQLVILSRQALPPRPGLRYIASLDAIRPSEHFDAVINLAGASLAARRWSAAYKREIVASRVDLTARLVATLGRLETPPPTLLSASAIGYYGHHGDEALAEDAAVTPGFAQQLCSDWEAAARGATAAGSRVCCFRLGVVLDADGGALSEMSRSFRFGIGSWIGSGSQWLSWVHRADVVAALLFLLERDDLQGPFNLTAPQAATGREFAAALARHFRTLFSAGAPAPLIRLALGEMADELLLNGQRVIPQRLLDAGFEFRYPDLASCLAAIYRRS